MKVVIKPEAERDLADAAIWYQGEADGLGIAFVGEIDATLSRFAARPALYPRVRGNVRRALVRRFPFAVCALGSDGQLTVYAAIHQSRDPALWKSRLDDIS